MKTGFIGLGAMGAPMARHVHTRGLLTAVGLLAAGSDENSTVRFGAGWHPLVEGIHPLP